MRSKTFELILKEAAEIVARQPPRADLPFLTISSFSSPAFPGLCSDKLKLGGTFLPDNVRDYGHRAGLALGKSVGEAREPCDRVRQCPPQGRRAA